MVSYLLLEIAATYQLADNRAVSLFTHIINVNFFLTYLLFLLLLTVN